MRISKVEVVVLGLLAEGPAHGYELLERLRERAMGLWAGIGRASVYQTLRRLEREGAIVGREQEGGEGPDRRVYRITSTGRARLRAGLRERARGAPDPLGFLHLVPPDEARRILGERADALARRRDQIAADRRRLARAADPADRLAYRMLELEDALAAAEQAWLEGLREQTPRLRG